MGLLTSDIDVDYYPPKTAPGTWADQGRNLISQLLGQIGGLRYPTQQVAGLSDQEQAGLGVLDQIISGGAFADPTSSPYYLGMRQQLKNEEEEGAGQLRRFAQLGGMNRSSPAMREEGKYRSDMAGQRMGILGSLYEAERQRDNQYNADVQNMLLPYTLGANLAQQQIGNEVWYGPTVTSSPSAFSEVAAPIALLGGLAAPAIGALGKGVAGLFGNSIPTGTSSTNVTNTPDFMGGAADFWNSGLSSLLGG